jgi:hypothetical protein
MAMKSKCIQCGKPVDESDPRVIYLVRDDAFLCDQTCENHRRIDEVKCG